MLDHVSVGVTDVARARAFYDAVLGALGYKLLHGYDEGAGYGADYPYFWIGKALDGGTPVPSPGTHICFKAPTRAAVIAFHRTALAHGATDAGEPGLRPQYTDRYYAAFVYDPDGHKIEAVTYDD